MSNDPQFMQYCKILGLDSNTIRNKIVKHVPMTITKQQKEKIKHPKSCVGLI